MEFDVLPVLHMQSVPLSNPPCFSTLKTSTSSHSYSIQCTDSLSTFSQTVAGTTSFFSCSSTPGVIFKMARGNETLFYQQVSEFPRLQSLVPKYYGTITLPTSSNPSTEYLVLEDLTHGLIKPCIMDVKLGIVHHDILTTAPSDSYICTSKYKTATELGFCVSGMKVYVSDRYEAKTTEYGRKLTSETVHEALAFFFANRKNVITESITRLQSIKKYFEEKPPFQMRSSSLLFVYDAEDEKRRVDVKIIDHAHAQLYSAVLPAGTPQPYDEYGYIKGLTNILSILEGLTKN
eukprot:TRINITY_DN650_c0_g1_i2.p1 TRINITY_DN650_c0_g1~~TRINITY_DN650_c0_g1_i2.p1  ORF type:complete len:291 (-),score=29.67 TRINITY_DN650_c0_g1_i2:113-985(-)